MTDPAASELSPARRRRSLAAAMVAITVVALTMGLTIPLTSLVLEARGVDSTWIGLNTTAQFVGILLISPFVPRILAAWGLMRSMWVGIAVSVVTIGGMPILDYFPIWFVLRFALGCAEGVIFVAAETWLNEIADDRYRGRTIGIYGTMLAGGLACGPLLIELTGIEGAGPFFWAAGLIALSAAPLLTVARDAPRIDGSPTFKLWRYASLVPVIIGANLMFGLLDAAAMGLLPVYGRDIGFEASAAARLLTVLILGGLAGQLPLGWLAERVNPSKLVVVLALMVAIGFAVIPSIHQTTWLMQLILFAIGSAVGGLWTVGLVALGNRYNGADLAAAITVATIAYGVGSAIGPSIAGTAMSMAPPHGLMIGLAAVTGLYVVFSVIHLSRRRDRSDA